MGATTSKIAASTSGGFPIEETHGIPLYPCNRLLAHSGALGWRSLYASYAAEQPWTATLRPLPHPCLAYFVNGGASIRRRVEGEAPQTAQLHARQFGLVPMRASSQWDLQGRPEVLTLYLRQAMVDRLAEEVFGRDPKHVELRPQLGVTDPLLEQLALALLRAMRDGERGAGLYVDHLAQTMAVQVLRGHCSGIARASAGNCDVSFEIHPCVRLYRRGDGWRADARRDGRSCRHESVLLCPRIPTPVWRIASSFRVAAPH